LLSGHTGFKGSWTALWLGRLGAEVTGFALPPASDPSLFGLADVARGMTSILGDLRERASVEKAMRRAEPQIILHMAAQPIVWRAIDEPVETIATNVLGTAHLLDAARSCAELQTILVVTSDKVYESDALARPHREIDALGATDPYSASKAAAELVTHAFARSYFEASGVRVGSARAGNVVGGGDYAQDRLVPDIVRAVAKGERVALRMPEATRPWQHVLDCVCGYLVYAEALARGTREVPPSLNFGPAPGGEVDVATLADAMLAALGARGGWDHAPVPGSLEVKELALDSTLAREKLGWRDRLRGERLVRWTAEWYRALCAGQSARDVTLRQIDRFTASASDGDG
jgi:CDP-glucose 4,6-dehydratase